MDKYFAGDGTNMVRYHLLANLRAASTSGLGLDLPICLLYGQLGLGDATDRNIPSLVPINNYQPKNVSCGWWHTLVLSESPT